MCRVWTPVSSDTARPSQHREPGPKQTVTLQCNKQSGHQPVQAADQSTLRAAARGEHTMRSRSASLPHLGVSAAITLHFLTHLPGLRWAARESESPCWGHTPCAVSTPVTSSEMGESPKS